MPVVLLGDANVDLVLDVPTLPRPGADALATSQLLGLGGSAANTAIMLRRLGVTCELISCVGQDEFGDLALASLADEGVGVAQIVRRATPTQINVLAVTPDGERTMFSYRGASAHLTPDDVDATAVASADLLHLSGYAFISSPQRDAAWRAVEVARAAGISVSLDVPVPAVDFASDQLQAVLPEIDLLIVGMPEARPLTGADDVDGCVAALLAGGVGIVALKLGTAGTLVASGPERIRIPGLPVTAVDTTGAGDAFAAGAIAGLLGGGDLAELGALANSCGACAVRTRGAGRHLPDAAEVRALLG